MSFVAEFNALPLADLELLAKTASTGDARAALGRAQPALADFAALISPAAGV